MGYGTTTRHDATIRQALDRQRAEREAHELREAAEQAERDRQNAEHRREYLAGLEAEKAEKRQRHEAAVDAQLQPRKDRERHRWLAEHPGRTVEDFEQVWRAHLRPVAVAELEGEALAATRARLVATGRYDF